MTAQTRSTLNTNITTDQANNNTGAISATDIRANNIDIIDSAFITLTDLLESIATAETDTSYILKPDGVGGVVFGVAPSWFGIVTTTSASYNVLSTDTTILCDTSSNAITVNLPAAASSSGRVIIVNLIDATNTATVDGNGSETINGATTQVLTNQYDSITMQCDGAAWYII
jgi:hypothetical protein